MAAVLYADEEGARMVGNGGSGSKTMRKCCCWCCNCLTAPLRWLWGALGGIALLVAIALIITIVFLADARAAAVSTVQSLQTTVAAYFSASSVVRTSFIAGAPSTPWAPWTELARGWIEYRTDTVALNVTAAAAGISLTQLVGRPAGSAAAAYNVTYAPIGNASELSAPGILAAWQRGDLFYLLLLAADKSVAASVLLPVN